MTAQFALVHSQTLYTGKDRIMLGVYKTKINFSFPEPKPEYLTQT